MAEVELKFELTEEAAEAFRELPHLARARPVDQDLLALYFDTPEQELVRHEMALRLRRNGDKWVQGLKAGRSGSGGLHAREEWEFGRRGASIDLSLFADTPLARLRDSAHLHKRLEEVFRVDMHRTTWELELAPGSRVEVALDRGAVRRDGRSDPVCEVEIECLEGEPLAVFELAEQLLGAVPMRPSTITKAKRGYRLLRGGERAPVKAKAPKLERSMAPGAAARVAVATALDQVQANEEGVLTTTDPEFLHQMRAAARRLRAALRIVRAAVGRAFEDEIRPEIQWITRLMGEARDWDVLATQTLPPLLLARGDTAGGDALVHGVAARRRAKGEALRDALRSPRHARLVLALARWLAHPGGQPDRDRDIGKLAARVLGKRHRKFMDAARHVAHRDPAERHRLRIEAKRFRYTVEAFASLFPKKRVKAFIDPLAKMQDGLGGANDAAVAERLIASLAAPAGLAQFARGWLEARAQAAIGDLERHIEALESATPFWRKR
jgi:inorganic triphosphatase YgiF